MGEILNIANNTFYARDKPIKIIHDGEAEVLALSALLTAKGHENLVVIDERTARLLCEKPQNLEKLLKKKLHTPIKAVKENYKTFRDYKIIRSTELAYVAHEKGFSKLKDPRTLDAILYALKFGGVSISEKEIKTLKKIKIR